MEYEYDQISPSHVLLFEGKPPAIYIAHGVRSPCVASVQTGNLRLRCSVCSLIIHELQLSSVSSTTLIFM